MVVNDVIDRLKHSIDEILDSSSQSDSDETYSQLVETRNLLDQLLQSNLPPDSSIRPFCLLLNRLMDYNKSLPDEFWIELKNIILYVLSEPNGEQNYSNSFKSIADRMTLEGILKQRELHFKETFGKRKTLKQLFDDHRIWIEDYLKKCTSFHSKVQVHGIGEDMDEFLRKNYGLTEVSLTSENRKRFEEKLKCIEIAFDYSQRLLESVSCSFSTYDEPYMIINNNISSFLPSTKPNQLNFMGSFFPVEQELQYHRWIVILGDPGSAKTTLLRWITRVFAEAAYRGDEKIDGRGWHSAVRVPILIQVGEFATWLEQHPKKTFMDFIGDHTWGKECYCHNGSKSALQELIYHGHALLLLDGLDEIFDVGRRKEVVERIKIFIHEYVYSPDFISVFDGETFHERTQPDWMRGIREMPLLSEPGGNQVVVTSRIVGYHLNPLSDPLMKHYLLPLMNRDEVKRFADEWMARVNQGVVEVLSNKGIQLNKGLIETLMKKVGNGIRVMLEKDSVFLMSNPFLLSVICKALFKSFDEFYPKTRIEVYDYAVQSALSSWTRQESIFSKSQLTSFLIDLAIYLHWQSPSGLIDEFDIERLCCLSLQRQGLSSDHTKLRKYAKELISLLSSNVGIVAERGLQVFGFVHLSIQEYFVAQLFAQEFSVDKVVKRLHTFIIDVRFRESLLLALGWISWKWLPNKYNELSTVLVTPTRDYAIPFGALFFLDALNDLQNSPSNSTILIALSSLLDNPSYIITSKHLILHLSKLHKDIITQWLQSTLTDIKYLTRFCQSLLATVDRLAGIIHIREGISIPSIICQHLWSFYNNNTPAEFLIDQTLRNIFMAKNAPDYIFNKTFSSYFTSNNIDVSNIHPLVLSAIIAVCGGVSFKNEKKVIKVYFSPKRMHRESSVIEPMIAYLRNNKECDSIKIRALIEHYESILKNSLAEDISLITVDTFIALICLQGLPQPSLYQKYNRYQALSLALNRLKRSWFYLWDCFHSIGYDNGISFITSDVESILRVFFLRTIPSDENRILFCLACAAACEKLGIMSLSDWLKFDIFRSNNMIRDLKCQPEFSNSISEEQIVLMAQNTHSSRIFHQEPVFLLSFIPQSLQQLYDCLTISPTNSTDSLPLVVLLSECLIHLEDVEKNNLNFYFFLYILQPKLNEHLLDNYVSVLCGKKNCNSAIKKQQCEKYSQMMKVHNLVDQLFINQTTDPEMLIAVERQRIFNVRSIVQTKDKDLRLFAASISLARLFQARYQFCENRTTKQISLSATESDEVYIAITQIQDAVLRIIAMSLIIRMKDPFIFDEKQRGKFRWEMIFLLQSKLRSLSLLTSTILFARCHSISQFFPMTFKYMASIIGEKLNETSFDKQSEGQNAAYIALQHLNKSDLSHFLQKFAERTENLPALLKFNSSIFLQYFTNATSFDSQNIILLSSMYLAELAFDVQILSMYTNSDHVSTIPLLDQLNQLWEKSVKHGKTMTFEVAAWITNSIQILNREEIHQIIADLSRCVMIERKALLVMETWLKYREDIKLRFFAYFATLHLIIADSTKSGVSNIINEMFDNDDDFHLEFIVTYLLTSPPNTLIGVNQILTALNRDARYSSQISFWIHQQQILELVLDLELKQITLNGYFSSEVVTGSFLFMVKGYSQHLQEYLKEYLSHFINTQMQAQDAVKEKYLAAVINWIITRSIPNNEDDEIVMELYEYLFTLLHDERFPLIQKAIINGLNSYFIGFDTNTQHVFMQYDTINHVEKIIHSHDIYSQDVLSVCLLTYGNYLLKLKELQIDRAIPKKIQQELTTIFDSSSLEIVSIRAAFCLIFAPLLGITRRTISNWFNTKPNMTCASRYRLLLQQTLYHRLDLFVDDLTDEIINCMQTNSTKLLDTFLSELYVYLCDKFDIYYTFDPVPNYCVIAVEFIGENSKTFCSAVQKSSFGEEMFKKELYLYCRHNRTCCALLIKLYAIFGVITSELVTMLGWLQYSWDHYDIWKYLNDIKQASDRYVIDQLFELLDKTACDRKLNRFADVLKLLIQLFQSSNISLLEIHQQFSLVMEKILVKYHNGQVDNPQKLYGLLLNISCIKPITSSLLQKEVFTERDIEKYFDKQIQSFDQRSSMFLRRNYFLNSIRSDLNVAK